MAERSHALSLELEAHNPARNHYRAYAVEVGQDLLRDWVVTFRFGRLAQPGSGRVLTYAVSDLDAARRLVRDRLKRRLSAPRRIGCAYRLRRLVLGTGEDVTAWVPDGLLSGSRGSATG
jgi:hypothetical protein